jgi:hypothetical protein
LDRSIVDIVERDVDTGKIRAIAERCRKLAAPRIDGINIAELPLGTRKSIFIRNPIIYLPLFLEVKRMLRKRTLGDYANGELSIRYGEESVVAASIQSILWLFGIPSEWSLQQSDNNHVACLLRFSQGSTVTLWLEQTAHWNQGRQALIRGKLFFEKGVLWLSSGNGERLFVECHKEESFHIGLPEGDGHYYFTLDVYESSKYNRESFIYPLRSACRSYEVGSKILRTIS